VPDKVARVVGLAASVPFDKNDPAAPINRRISIVVMTREAARAALSPEVATEPASPDATKTHSAEAEHVGAGMPQTPASAPGVTEGRVVAHVADHE